MAKLSRDQELVERLKQQFAAYPPHDWKERYDEQGSLLGLNLDQMKLTQLPPELWQFASLQDLYLSDNQLSSLPAELGQIANLQMLDLGYNQLNSLPAELGQLTHLQRLWLNDNQLNNLPAELGQLANLKELDLRGNQLSSLPAELGQLIHLGWLGLDYNQLSSLPAELGQRADWPGLDYNLRTHLGWPGLGEHLQLQIPPSEVVALVHGARGDYEVKFITRGGETRIQLVSDQELVERLKQQFAAYPSHDWKEQYDEQGSLLGLNLDQMKLTQLPPKLWQFINLKKLYLNDNQLSSLPAELGQLTNLQVLNLRGNQFSSLPAELGQLTNLRWLNLDENPQLQIPPPEIVKQGTSAVLAYLRAGPQAKEMVSLKIFYCYAHKDKNLRDRIDKHLGVLKRLGEVVEWHDREIQAGTEWEREIEAHLSTASIILLLVSADFVNSDYCYGVEMQKALELHEKGEAHVLPILLRPVVWQGAPFAKLQILPTGAKPITTWRNQDEALEDVAEQIRAVVTALRT